MGLRAFKLFAAAGALLLVAGCTYVTAQDVPPTTPPVPSVDLTQPPEENAAVTNTQDEHAEAEQGMQIPDDPMEVQMDCSIVPEFPDEVFADQPDNARVYLATSPFPDTDAGNIFLSMGFDRYLRVFGVPLMATAKVSDDQLRHAAKILADTLDSERTGTPVREGAVQFIRSYNAVVGYLSGADESEKMWGDLFLRDEAELFRQQFVCNMHFFEQWASDTTPEFHDAKRVSMRYSQPEGNTTDATDVAQCDDTEFDWAIWYLPFTATYYGFLEDFDQDEKDALEKGLLDAREKGTFSQYATDDPEMERSDFFVWSLLTSMGALDCYCGQEVISDVWKICTRAEMENRHPVWLQALESLEGVPHRLPSPTYDSVAVVKANPAPLPKP